MEYFANSNQEDMRKKRSSCPLSLAFIGCFRFCQGLPLIIQRVLCQSCSRSHALIPSGLVPYSQIPLEDQVSLIEAFEKGGSPGAVLDENPEIDDRTPFRLIRMYLIYWRERLLSERIILRPLARLTRQCLSLFGKQSYDLSVFAAL